MKIILASQSPRRKQILEELGLDFTVCPSQSDEIWDASLPVQEALKQIAYAKAEEVSRRYPDALVLAADTIVVFHGKVYGKPKDEQEAFEVLKSFSNDVQDVMTGICILYQGKRYDHVDTTKVYFRELSDAEILAYIKTHNVLDKAGSYGIQESDFESRIEGSMTNVIGLSKESVQKMLKKISDVSLIHPKDQNV